jgi:hypothetical protein
MFRLNGSNVEAIIETCCLLLLLTGREVLLNGSESTVRTLAQSDNFSTC